MTDRAKLIELAERCEAASGPDWGLDKEVFRVVRAHEVPAPIVSSGYGWREDGSGWWLATGEDARTPPKTIYPPRYTASLDAAMTLVPSNHTPAYCKDGVGIHLAEVRRVGVGTHISWPDFPNPPCKAPALALTAACLRARTTENRHD